MISKIDPVEQALIAKAKIDTDIAPYVYHYTSVKALMSIVESRSFWASDVMYLNDAREVAYGADLFKGKANSLVKDKSRNEQFRHAINYLCDFVGDKVGVCAVSFCFNRDLLSQWRGYGGDQGVSIGVSSKYISELSNYDLLRVVYDRSDQEGILEAMLLAYANMFVDKFGSRVEKDNEFGEEFDFVISASYYFEKALAIFKDPAFSEEGEIRAFSNKYVHTKKAGVKFRERGGVIIPYYELPLDMNRSGVFDIFTVGPGPSVDLVQKSIEVFLEANGLKTPVETSSVALRK
ncbi:MAG: DUF2971 domain-containing protein [Niveispirillum sp.]|uniref:DUF2971 domain-containing protein n=1 Tax=Niveispirillum sp. TaxID=1917217 RepID=UPI004035AB1B